MPARYLVTGGAGYVGSHLVAALVARGDDVVVLDNLRLGHRAAVLPPARFVEGDIADAEPLLAEGGWDGVLHFAALSQVGESMTSPMLYFAENAAKGIRFIEACVRHGIPRFVLSSTAAVYAATGDGLLSEESPLAAASPYGETKRMLERTLDWADRICGMRCAALRYFNAAGADPAGRLGEAHQPETHLIPRVIDAALGRGSGLKVFGRDYPTPDGTAIRDYIHVSDLASAHLAALDRLSRGSVVYNVGTGYGHSVLHVIDAVRHVSGVRVDFEFAPRRLGDPAVLVASSAKLQGETGWRPRFAALEDIVRSAFAWREAHPNGYDD